MRNIIKEAQQEEEQIRKNAIAADKTALIMHLVTIVVCVLLLILHLFDFVTIDKSGKYLLGCMALGLIISGILLVYTEIHRFLKPKNYPLPRLSTSILWLVLGAILSCVCFVINHEQLECNRVQDICTVRNTLTKTVSWQRKLSGITDIEKHTKLSIGRASMFESIAVSSEDDPTRDGFCGALILLQDRIISILKNKTLSEEMQFYINSNYPSFIIKSNCGVWTLFSFCVFIAGLIQIFRIITYSKRGKY